MIHLKWVYCHTEGKKVLQLVCRFMPGKSSCDNRLWPSEQKANMYVFVVMQRKIVIKSQLCFKNKTTRKFFGSSHSSIIIPAVLGLSVFLEDISRTDSKKIK